MGKYNKAEHLLFTSLANHAAGQSGTWLFKSAGAHFSVERDVVLDSNQVDVSTIGGTPYVTKTFKIGDTDNYLDLGGQGWYDYVFGLFLSSKFEENANPIPLRNNPTAEIWITSAPNHVDEVNDTRVTDPINLNETTINSRLNSINHSTKNYHSNSYLTIAYPTGNVNEDPNAPHIVGPIRINTGVLYTTIPDKLRLTLEGHPDVTQQ